MSAVRPVTREATTALIVMHGKLVNFEVALCGGSIQAGWNVTREVPTAIRGVLNSHMRIQVKTLSCNIKAIRELTQEFAAAVLRVHGDLVPAKRRPRRGSEGATGKVTLVPATAVFGVLGALVALEIARLQCTIDAFSDITCEGATAVR
eukprot:gnl/TRDRNA2_/TRDRNA2_174937_c12_seq31.p2 gnl/TRDRNA2_/TRDRNA2_174937_c12~~gnl/TRDRNA2_/TRDRNA2_174937_c12_seq31.p2  ORF type:complete len:149 (+),score=15.18 gnl/TRDRNA2_/TRDRNA2_174937_c12_seq31:313-759(+)